MKSKLIKIPEEIIIQKIFFIRDIKVMLDHDLAQLYGVKTKRLNEQVKRNIDKFPEHFMIQLSTSEMDNLKSQNATSRWGGRRNLPFAFTEHGVLQLANVIKSARATQMSIRIIEVFVRMRELLSTHKDVLLKLDHMEKQLSKHDGDIQLIFEALKELLNPKLPPRQPVGFKLSNK